MAWLKRDVSILDYANVSMMRNYVTTLLKQAMLVSESNNPVISDVQLVVNTYPYLMDEKLANLTAIAIGQMLEYPLDVKLCYMKPSEITLPFFRARRILNVYPFMTSTNGQRQLYLMWVVRIFKHRVWLE